MSQWECPDGLMVDQWSRYSGCNVGADLSKALAWYYLLVLCPLVLLWLYVALELYRHDPMSSPSRMQGMVYAAVGIAMFMIMGGNAAVDQQTPASSKLVVSLAAGIGVLCFSVGGWRLVIGHYVASCFQMVSRLEGGREVVERVGSNALFETLLLVHTLLIVHRRSTP
jgi:hypothetical protein